MEGVDDDTYSCRVNVKFHLFRDPYQNHVYLQQNHYDTRVIQNKTCLTKNAGFFGCFNVLKHKCYIPVDQEQPVPVHLLHKIIDSL